MVSKSMLLHLCCTDVVRIILEADKFCNLTFYKIKSNLHFYIYTFVIGLIDWLLIPGGGGVGDFISFYPDVCSVFLLEISFFCFCYNDENQNMMCDI